MESPSEFYTLYSSTEVQMHNVHQLVNIHLLLREVLFNEVPGDIAELGCYNGTAALVLQKTVRTLNPEKELHLYDSFEGLPESSNKDEPTEYEKGSCKTTKEDLISKFAAFDEPLPVIHEGWFKEVLPDELPEQICFAHLDGDLYRSIMCGLQHVYPRLTKGGVVVIDDYCDPDLLESDKSQVENEILPGVRRAVTDFLSSRPETVRGIPAGPGQHHGYFKRL